MIHKLPTVCREKERKRGEEEGSKETTTSKQKLYKLKHTL